MTKDRDFLHLLFEQGPPPQVVWLRVGNSSNQALQAVLLRTLEQALASLRDGEPWVEVRSPVWRREVFISSSPCGLLFNIQRKSEARFSPTGQRYIHHAARSSRMLLFVREQRRVDGRPGGVTEPFRCLGICHRWKPRGRADLVSRGVAIRWRLEREIPVGWLPVMGLAVWGEQTGTKVFAAAMSYRIRLPETEEGWALSCLDLPGCHSQGNSREEALTNIREAIALWLEVEGEEAGVKSVETLELAV